MFYNYFWGKVQPPSKEKPPLDKTLIYPYIKVTGCLSVCLSVEKKLNLPFLKTKFRMGMVDFPPPPTQVPLEAF